MINEYIRYRIAPERVAAFLAAYDEAQASLRASPHCLGYELSRCTDDPQYFILKIQWDSADGHLEGFRKGPQFPPFLRAVRPFVGDIEEMRHYDVTRVQWARQP